MRVRINPHKSMLAMLVLANILAMTVAGRAVAAATCYSQTQAIAGKHYFVVGTCPDAPGIVDINSNKCYVTFNNGGITFPTPYDNGLACGAAMVNVLKQEGALPDGCPYSGVAGTPSVGCPYLDGQFGTLNPDINNAPRDVSIGATPPTPSTSTPVRIEDDDALIATLEQNPIYVRLIQVVNFLSAGVILIIIIAITISGIQYSASGDSPDMAKMAKDRIKNAVIALVLYLFMYALLQWIVPGGLF